MALARFMKLCVDANDPESLGTFWARALGLRWEADGHGEGGVFGRTQGHTIWFNAVPESKTVKHRVHFDIYTTGVAELEQLGARVVVPEGDDRHWTVMADPEDGEFCAFVRPTLPDDRLHGLVVDTADPAAQARWWANLLGGSVVDTDRSLSTVEGIAGMPIATMDFVAVPEPKTAKNRIHPDVAVTDVAPLLDAGARVLAEPSGDVEWYVLADPEGNELCAFLRP